MPNLKIKAGLDSRWLALIDHYVTFGSFLNTLDAQVETSKFMGMFPQDRDHPFDNLQFTRAYKPFPFSDAGYYFSPDVVSLTPLYTENGEPCGHKAEAGPF